MIISPYVKYYLAAIVALLTACSTSSKLQDLETDSVVLASETDKPTVSSNVWDSIYNSYNIYDPNKPDPKFFLSISNKNDFQFLVDPDSVLYAWVRYDIYDFANHSSTGIPSDRFNQLKNLGFLVFDGRTKYFSTEVDFRNFPELRYLSSNREISEGQLTQLFTSATNLKGVSIVLTGTLPECICDLEYLEYLEIENRSSRITLPECLKGMNGLKYLSIVGNGVGYESNVNDVIWDISSLEAVNLDGGGERRNQSFSGKNGETEADFNFICRLCWF